MEYILFLTPFQPQVPSCILTYSLRTVRTLGFVSQVQVRREGLLWASSSPKGL